jgi:hypothetical protein
VKFTKHIIIIGEFRNRKETTCHRGNSKNITKVEIPIGTSSKKRCLTNMREVHTCPIGGVNLVGTMVDITGIELAQLARQMIRSTGVHVPVRINIGLSVPLLTLRSGAIGHGGLTSIVAGVLAVIPNAKEAALKPAMTLRGEMAVTPTELAHACGSTST